MVFLLVNIYNLSRGITTLNGERIVYMLAALSPITLNESRREQVRIAYNTSGLLMIVDATQDGSTMEMTTGLTVVVLVYFHNKKMYFHTFVFSAIWFSAFKRAKDFFIDVTDENLLSTLIQVPVAVLSTWNR